MESTIMKIFIKPLLVLMALTVALSMISCSDNERENNTYNLYFEDEQEWGKNKINEAYSAIKGRDSEALKAMFSKNVLEKATDIDESIADLFEMIGDEATDIEITSSVSTSKSSHYGKINVHLNYAFSVYTDSVKLCIVIEECVFDNENSDNIGLSIMKITDETDRDWGYWVAIEDDDPLGIIINTVKDLEEIPA